MVFLLYSHKSIKTIFPFCTWQYVPSVLTKAFTISAHHPRLGERVKSDKWSILYAEYDEHTPT